MTLFDLIVIALVSASVVSGLLRGLARALITFVALFVGLMLAARGYLAVGALLRGLGIFESQAAANASGFLLIVVGMLVAGFAIGQLFKRGLQRARLSWFDSLLGGAFGLARGLAVCSILYLALTAFPVRINAVTEARTAPALAEGARLLAVLTGADVRTRFLDEYQKLTDSK